MTSKAAIDEFVNQKKYVLIRSSAQKKVQGCCIHKELTAKGYEVEVLYLDQPDLEERLLALKETIGAGLIAVPVAQAEEAVLKLSQAGITRIWIQEGSESEAALGLCKQHQLSVIHGECILMFFEPVTSFHAFHRWLWKFFGKLPA